MLNKRILVLIFLLVSLPLVGCFPSPAPPITENQVPIITSIPITSVTVGETYVYDVEATDPDGDTLAYSLSTKPTGMTINPATGLIKWTPKVKGNYAVFVKVSDGALDITQSFTIVVSEPSAPPPVNHAPIITSIPNLTSLTKIVYIYEVKATDPDGDVLTYSLTVKPDGMAIDSTTGTVSWIPSLDQIGSNPVTVKASDGKKSTTQSFTIVVEAVKLIGIEVIPNQMTLFVGRSEAFKVIAHYNNDATKNVTWDCVYRSTDLSIAFVPLVSLSSDSRSVKALKVGTVGIAVDYIPDGEIFTDTIAVTVIPKIKPVYLQLYSIGDGTAEWTDEQAYSGSYSVKFHAVNWGEDGFALGIPVDIPLNQITELSYWRNGVVFDYAPPSVLLCIDANGDGELDFDISEALSYGPLGDDAILVIEADWIDIGWSNVDVLAKDWRWGAAWWIDKNGWSGWLTYSSLEEFIDAGGFGPSDAGYLCTIDPADHIMLVVIAGGNPDGDVYVDDITINGETYDLEPD